MIQFEKGLREWWLSACIAVGGLGGILVDELIDENAGVGGGEAGDNHCRPPPRRLFFLLVLDEEIRVVLHQRQIHDSDFLVVLQCQHLLGNAGDSCLSVVLSLGKEAP